MESTTTDNTKEFDIYNIIDDSHYPNAQAKITRKRYKIDDGQYKMNILSKLTNELKEKEEWLEKQKEALAEVVKNIQIYDDGYDWTLYKFHHYQLFTTTGKILLLKKLIRDFNKND